MSYAISNSIEKFVKDATESCANELLNSEIEKAVKNFEKKLRGELANCAVEVSNLFSVRETGREIIITCKIEKDR